MLRHAVNIKDLLVSLVRPPGQAARQRSEGLVELMVERLHWSWHVWLVVELGGLGGLTLGRTWEHQLTGGRQFAA